MRTSLVDALRRVAALAPLLAGQVLAADELGQNDATAFAAATAALACRRSRRQADMSITHGFHAARRTDGAPMTNLRLSAAGSR